jgi:hypothetical protein
MKFGRIALGFAFVVTTAYGQVATQSGADLDGEPVTADPSNFAFAPADDQIRRWLESDDPRLTAWGAHYAFDQTRTVLPPDLEGVIDRWEQSQGKVFWDTDHVNAVAEVLDAVIEMDGKLPARTIKLAMDRTQNGYLDAPLALLLLRLPADEAEPVWEKTIFTGDIRGGIQRVAADVLSPHPPPGFAARLMGGLFESGDVTVVDPGVSIGRGRGGSYPDGFGAGMGRAKSDWPKIGVYALLDTPTKTGSVLLLDGIDPIYIKRLVVPVDQYGQIYNCSSYGLTTFTGLTEERRLRLIRSLLHSGKSELPVESNPNLFIEFHTAKLYRSQMDAFVKKQLAQFALVSTELTKARLMTEDERRTTTLHFQIGVTDCRKVRKPPLPVPLTM